MTDRELIEKILKEVSGMNEEMSAIKGEISGMKEEMSAIKGEISGMKEETSAIKGEISGMKTDIKLVKTQQSEHGEILQAVRHAQEAQKAQLDRLEVELAKLSGEQQKSFETLINMYGRHEFEITQLKQVK